MTLKETAVGQTVKVKKLTGEGPVKRRIMEKLLCADTSYHSAKQMQR